LAGEIPTHSHVHPTSTAAHASSHASTYTASHCVTHLSTHSGSVKPASTLSLVLHLLHLLHLLHHSWIHHPLHSL
jgi:hypothetical protein